MLKRLALSMATGLVAVIGITFVLAQQGRENGKQSPEIIGDVPLFETTAWRTQGELLLRTSAEDAEDLLLLHRKVKKVYRWDPSTERLRVTVPYEDWERATGPIDVYESEFPSSPLRLRELLANFNFSPEGGWMVRSEGHDKDTLLLTHLRREMVYRYDRTTQELALVPHERWEAGGEPVVKCPSGVTPSGLRIKKRESPSHPRLDRLLAGDRVIRTAGARALIIRTSPSGRFAAVLSADGDRKESPVPLFGDGMPDGQHFHELLSLPDFTRVGDPVRLPMTSKEIVSLGGCWSPDERYVVYADLQLFGVVSVVPVDIPLQEEVR